MNFNLIAGAAATAALLIPVFLLLVSRLVANGSLLALFVYYLYNVLYNLMNLNVLRLAPAIKQKAAIIFNYLDAPLMLLVLLFFCNERWQRLLVLAVLSVFLLFEMGVALLFRLDVQSSVYLLGPGTLLVLGLSIYFFAHYGRICIVQGKGTGKTLMLVSILFLYGCFTIIYYLHYLIHTPAIADVFLIYYAGLFISALIMTVGLVWIIRRQRELKELQVTRKELALFFNS